MESLGNVDLLVLQSLVRFVRPSQFKGVGDGGLTLLHAGDDIGAADPVGLFVIGFRPLGGMIGMGMVETDDVFSAVAAFALDADQFFRIDVVAVVSGIGAGVAATCSAGDGAGAVVFEAAEENSTAFVGIGLFAMAADSFVVGFFELQHFRSGFKARSRNPHPSKIAKDGAPSVSLTILAFGPEPFAQIFIAGVAQNRNNHRLLISS